MKCNYNKKNLKMFVEIKSTDMMVGVKYAVLTSYDLVAYSTGTLEYRNEDSSVHKFDYLVSKSILNHHNLFKYGLILLY